MKSTGIFLHSSKPLSISCWLDLEGSCASGFIWFFIRKRKFSIMLKSGLCAGHGKALILWYTHINFGKYWFVRGCIDLWEDEWLTFFSSIAFVPWNKISCNLAIYFSAFVCPLQAAHLPKLIGPTGSPKTWPVLNLRILELKIVD